MNELASIAEDLAFVRRRVRRSQETSFPASILYLWAVIVLAGSIITDLSPTNAATFWLAAGPIGGIVSAVLGRRWAAHRGHDDSRQGITQGLHWAALLIALFAALIPVFTGAISGQAFGTQALLIVSLAYFYAGLHIHRPLLWLAGLQLSAYVLIVVAPALPQTVTGLMTALGFAAVGIAAQRRTSTRPMLQLER